MQQREENCMFFKDNGPGLTHSELKTALTGQASKLDWENQTNKICNMLKYAALRLAESCLVITKSLQHTRVQFPLGVNNVQVIEQVHIGLLSSKFIKDSGSGYLLAPIVSFNVKRKE